jgi:hypothetical protein
MRVHELAAELGTSNDALGDFLEGLGEKRSHLAGVSPEAAALALDHFSEGQWGIGDDGPYADELTTFEAFAASTVANLEAVQDIAEQMPESDRFEMLTDGGAFREMLCLDPVTADRLRAALKGRSIADATLLPERGELVAVTWPCYQKLVVKYD